jgi:hypothetical protein
LLIKVKESITDMSWEDVFDDYDLDDLDAGSDVGSLLEWGSDGLAYTGSLMSSLPAEDQEDPSELPDMVTTHEEFTRSIKTHWQMIPVTCEIARSAGEILTSMSDEEILDIPPSVLVHLQRTAAQGGTQVISPRQVTLGGIAGRTSESRRQPDMHIVGSNATRGLPWPTAAGMILTNLWHKEPLDAYPNTPAVRARTSVNSVVVKGDIMLDPVELAVVKSRALIDMQRRPDIGGDADGLAEAIAAAWGIDPESYYDVAGTLIEGSGNLLRYAIGPDKHYPVLHAPIQARKVISVAAMATGRDVYGEFSALDWRRIRVLAEAVFYMASRTEGHTMEDMAQRRPIGDPSTVANRAGTMQFRPMPGAVWTFDPKTFSLSVGKMAARSQGLILPDRLARVLEEQLDTVRLHTADGPSAHRVTYTGVDAAAYVPPTAETLVAGFVGLQRVAAAFQAKGYTADSTAAGFIYNCMKGDRSSNSIEATWVTRAVAQLAQELGVAHAVDARMARQVGSRLTVLTDDFRQKMVVEAEKHGATLEEWWHDFSSRLPMELRCATESNQAWSSGIAWHLLARPGSRWIRLSAALANESHRAMANSHLVDMLLPPQARSKERVVCAVEISAARLARSYGAYYHAIADGCYLLSSRMARAGNASLSSVLRLGGRMWDIRAAATYTLRVVLDNPGTAAAATVSSESSSEQVWLKISPYRSYVKWREAAAAMGLDLSSYPMQVEGRVSGVFQGKHVELADCEGHSTSRALRYVSVPSRLHLDIEKTVGEIADTLGEVMERYSREGMDDHDYVEQGDAVELAGIKLDLSRFAPARGSLWDVISQLDSHDATWVADLLEELPPDACAALEAGRYVSGQELLAEAMRYDQEAVAQRANEAVR